LEDKAMNGHEHFEELCALFAGGLGTERELRELREHLADCADCRKRVSDFVSISVQALVPREEQHAGSHSPPRGMLDRFVQCAAAEGIPIPRHERESFWPRFALRPRILPGAIAATIFLVVLLSAIVRKQHSHSAPPDRIASAPQSSVQVPTQGSSAATAENATLGNALPGKAETDQLRAALASAQVDRRSLEKKANALEEQLQTAVSHEGQLSSRITSLERDNQDLRQESQEKGRQIAEIEGQLKKKESLNAGTVVALAERQIRIDELKEKLNETEAELVEQRRLLEASNQARDLIIARNLHIVDVHDRVGSEGRRRAFGRIFYTEGKSLVFYAYDLADPEKLNAKVTFYLWGERLGGQERPRNLGIFRNEDPSAGRWVLSFDDPRVLAQINTVFVTAEPAKKEIDQPKGKHVLFAFLGAEPNHP
jgi:hypothetical protein